VQALPAVDGSLNGGPSRPRPGWKGWIEGRLLRTWWSERPTALAHVLAPLALLYRGLVARRRYTADAVRPGSVPVLVVGNLIVGGAGKTPAVIALVQAFSATGRRPGVVTRGYGREGHSVCPVVAGATSRQVGDEAVLIQRRTGVPVWVGQSRAAAVAALLREHPGVDVIVSDDGLQHAALARSAELLVFDDRGVGNGHLLPAGPLRQPMPADLLPHQRVLYSGTRVSTALAGAVGRRSLSQAWPLGAWLAGQPAAALPLRALRGRPLLAAAGLADPERFFAMLEAYGLQIERLPLPDHHDYATLPWPRGTSDVLVTEKDAVKLNPQRMDGTQLWVVPLDFLLPAGLAEELLGLLPLPS
jgi:tetraacyldisaccharide 4'-kinase